MIFMGAEEWYFWLGIKAAVYRLCDESDMGPNLGTACQDRCLQAYTDGLMVGLELTLKEYKEMLK